MASTSGLLDLDDARVGRASCSATLGVDRDRLPQIADVPVWSDAACSNAGAGCTTAERAALMVGTSGALRVLYESERPQPQPGLFLYLADERRVVEGGALSDGGNLYAWLERTLADASGSLAERDPRDHGLVFLPFLGGERSTGWNPDARGTIHGLTFDDDAARHPAGRLRGRRVPLRCDRRPAARGARGRRDRRRRCCATATGSRSWPTRSRGRSPSRAWRRRRYAAPRFSRSSAPATRSHEAPLGEVVEPRADRADAYRAAREEQQRLYDALT